MEITSVNNELVKQTAKFKQKKYRDKEKKFLLESFKAIEEAFKSGIEIEQIFVNKENHVMLNLCQHLIRERLRGHEPSSGRHSKKTDLILTNESILKKISTTDTPPEAVAVSMQKIFTLEDIKSAKKVTLLENIKDLGNLGTILRTAKAFSQDAVILFGDTADLYNPKCVRSAAGNLWKIPVVQIKDFKTLKSAFTSFERIATLPKSTNTIFLKDFETKPSYLIMFGSEAQGLSKELIDFSTKKITIEMNSDVESLNLSVSVGIVLHKMSLA